MAAQQRRAFPAITAVNQHFWCGGADGQLHILRCANRHWIHPYAARCPTCGSAEIAPQPVSGLGTVAGFTVNHQPWLPDVPVPYVVAVVELAERHDLRLMTNMPRTPIEDVHVGMPVKVFFEQHGDVFLPLFEAA
jgi:uncharacterized OB-fold protein